MEKLYNEIIEIDKLDKCLLPEAICKYSEESGELIRELNKTFGISYDSKFQMKDDFSCTLHLSYNFSSLNKLSNLQKNRIRYYVLQQYTNCGWDITGSTTDNWTFKFNRAALREKNIDTLLED